MNERLSLFLDNVEKIRLFFGSHAESFVISMATQLTIRGQRFYGFDYDDVNKTIKNHSKWYSTVRHRQKIVNAYYVHYSKDPSLIPKAIERQKQIQHNKFTETEDSYIAAIYIENGEKLEELTQALIKQSSLRYESLRLPQRALLSTRPEVPIEIAVTYEQYYKQLLSLKWKRGIESKNAAFLLTLETGTFQEPIIERLVRVESLLHSINLKIEKRHYSVICLLALANFEKTQLNALLELQDTINTKLKLNPKYYNTLGVAAQLYTATELANNSEMYYTDIADILMTVIDNGGSDGSDGGGDGGGGD